MITHLPKEIIEIIESFVSKESHIVIPRGRTPLITRLFDISCLNLKPYIFDRSYLSKNPNLVYLLEKGLNHINWRLLSKDIYTIDYNFLRTRPQNILGKKQDDAIRLLEKNIDKINWHYLSENPNSIY